MTRSLSIHVDCASRIGGSYQRRVVGFFIADICKVNLLPPDYLSNSLGASVAAK